MRKYFLLIILFLFSAFQLMAQPTADPSTMESHGKIYVVMAVCLTIFTGIVIYLIRIDSKIASLEKKND